MKVAVVCDSHAGCRNDNTVFVDYCISFFTEQFIPYLLDKKIDTVIHLGDVFDRRKYLNIHTLYQWKTKVFDVLEQNNIKLHIILGNHDVFFKNTNEVNSVQEVLSSYKNIVVYSKPQTINLDGLPVFILPWIPLGCEAQNIEAIEQAKAQLCMGHLEIKGFEMHAGHMNQDHGYDSDVFSKFDAVLSGHFHHRSHKGNIFYLGSPYQMTWADFGDIRGFHILDTETRALEFIENPTQIFHKLYYNDEDKTLDELKIKYKSLNLKNLYVKIIVEKKDNPQFYEQFLESVYQSNPADVSIVEQILYMTEEDNFDSAKDTLTILKEYVNASDVAQKHELNELLTSLYNEALTLDIQE